MLLLTTKNLVICKCFLIINNLFSIKQDALIKLLIKLHKIKLVKKIKYYDLIKSSTGFYKYKVKQMF